MLMRVISCQEKELLVVVATGEYILTSSTVITISQQGGANDTTHRYMDTLPHQSGLRTSSACGRISRTNRSAFPTFAVSASTRSLSQGGKEKALADRAGTKLGRSHQRINLHRSAI